MKTLATTSLALSLCLVCGVVGQTASRDAASLTGTWSSKSHAVFTGPGFYNPVEDYLIEPSLTGSSYSFTADGFFEEALYFVVSNRKCLIPDIYLMN